MPTTVHVGGCTYWLNDLLKSNLDKFKELPLNEFDNVNIIDGMEGYGKTRFAVTLAHYLTDGAFTEKDIVFTIEEFNAWVDDPCRKPGDACVWDEFVLAGSSADALKKMQTTLIKKLTLMRKKRFHIFFVIPYVFMLRKYFAIARARNLLTVQPKGGDALQRGQFAFYGYRAKKKIYVRGLKTWEYCTKPDFKGYFAKPPNKIIDWEAYEERKDKIILSLGDEEQGTRLKQVTYHRNLLLAFCKDRLDQTDAEMANLIGVSRSTITMALRNVKSQQDTIN